MREIEFRGKTKLGREWINGGVVHQTDWYGDLVDRWFVIDGTDTNDYDIGNSYEVIPETVGQFTGLLDKNGTKIFEGDIVKWGHLPHSYEKPIRIAAVASNPDIQYRTVTMRDPITHRDYYFKQGCFAYAETQFYLEVIGNIHENPELLEEEK